MALTLGCKNKKQPSGPIELDLEAGNLVFFAFNKKIQLFEFPNFLDKGLKIRKIFKFNITFGTINPFIAIFGFPLTHLVCFGEVTKLLHG